VYVLKMARRKHLKMDCSSSSSDTSCSTSSASSVDCRPCESSCASSSTECPGLSSVTCAPMEEKECCNNLDYLCGGSDKSSGCSPKRKSPKCSPKRKSPKRKSPKCSPKRKSPKRKSPKRKCHKKQKDSSRSSESSEGCELGSVNLDKCNVAAYLCSESSSTSCSSSSSSSCSSSSSECSIIVPDMGCEYGRKCEWTDTVEKDTSCPSTSSSSSTSSASSMCSTSSSSSSKTCSSDSSVCSGCRYSREHCKCDKIVGRTFEVLYVSKEGHPWQHRITTISSCISVNGRKGVDVHLTRGHTYRFVINPEGLLADQDFYFTHDVQGGPMGFNADSPTYDPVKLPGTPDPVASGVIILKADWSLPKSFYYQSKLHNCCGGRVFIHDN